MGSVLIVQRFDNLTVRRVNFKAQPLKLRLALTLTLTLTVPIQETFGLSNLQTIEQTPKCGQGLDTELFPVLLFICI